MQNEEVGLKQNIPKPQAAPQHPQQQFNKSPMEKPEERKRGVWGQKQVAKAPSGNHLAVEQNEPMSENSPDNKKKKKEDWNYLKQTLRSNKGMIAQGNEPEQEQDQGQLEYLTFHEKADELVEEGEELRSKHIEYLRESAQLLTEEGKIISNVQGLGNEDFDMDDYVNRMEQIVQRNLEIYGDMQRRLQQFKMHMQEEEEAHK